jgi:hypothetical protein
MALAETRGAVMAVARLSESIGTLGKGPGLPSPQTADEIEAACVGNVSVHAYGFSAGWRMLGTSFVLDAPDPTRKPVREEHPLGPRDALVLFTDGLSTRTQLEGDLDLLREHPIVIAHQLALRFGRDNDDALVLVVR